MAVDTPYDFHIRNKHEFYRSLMDGFELENAAANYLFSKMNLERQNLFTKSPDDLSFDYAANEILKAKWSHAPFRTMTSEQFGLSNEPWIKRLTQFKDGHNNPRNAHAAWPSMDDVDPTQAYGGISPWDLSALTANSEWGQPEWLRALSDVWHPTEDDDGNVSNHHKSHLESETRDHERHHEKSFHNVSSYLGELGHEDPSDLYEKHFARWKAEAADPEVLDMSLYDQKKAHLEQYKRVWAGKERDPLGDATDTEAHGLGLLGYGLGLEWMTPSQRDEIIQHLSEHGTETHYRDGTTMPSMPHMPVGWMNRNWAGRFLGGEAIQRLRDPSYAGSMLTAPHYGFDTEDQKDGHNARRLRSALDDVMVYNDDNAVLGVKKGDIAHGYFNDDDTWVHDEHHEDSQPIYNLGNRSHHEANLDPRLLTQRQQDELGVQPLMRHLLGKKEHQITRNLQQDGRQKNHDLQILSRYLKRGDGTFDHVHSSNFPYKPTKNGTDRQIEEHHNRPIWPEEIQHWQETGVINENQATALLNRRTDLHEEYERRKQVSNATGPFTNLYHHAGGDAGDIRVSPYARFMMMHHTQGGMGGDSLNPFTELDHMFHNDVWGGPDGGLFTSGSDTSSMKAMELKEGDSPMDFPHEIWPRATGMEGENREAGDIREGSTEVTLPRTSGRDNIMSLIGAIQEQPIDTMRGKGALWNLPHGGNTDHNLQLATTADPHFHEGLRDGTGPMRLVNPYKQLSDDISQASGAEYNEARKTIGHASSTLGKQNMKKTSLMAALLLRWNENPAEAQAALGPPPGLRTGQLQPKYESLHGFTRDLQQYANQEGMHLIPGHPGDTDLESRIRQFLVHSDMGRNPNMEQPLALDKPAIESFQEGLGQSKLSLPGGRAAGGATSPGLSPGQAESDEAEGWLNPNIERGKWYLYDKNKDMGPRAYQPLDVNIGNGKTQTIRPKFDFHDQAHSALENGKMDCPVCGGDGYIDPEDMGAQIEKSVFDLLGEGDDSNKDRAECPNCHGSKTMQLPSTFNHDNTHAQPHHDDWKEQHLTSQLEDWLETDPEHRDPEHDDAWFEDIENQIQNIQSPQAYGTEGSHYMAMQRFGHKLTTTQNLVRNVATSLADTVRGQFESDGLPDPFGPDENGDWSQAHVNAIALWSHANEWALRAQPSQRTWQGDKVAGYTDGHNFEFEEGKQPSANSSIYYPDRPSADTQSELGSLPLSIYNSMGHRMRHGWGMSPNFGMQFDAYGMGDPKVLHNNGNPSSQRSKFLNVPLNELQQVFPEMGTMSAAHPSAPSAEDIPETQKLSEDGTSAAFQLSEDEPAVSDILKALTNPDLLKDDDARVKPVKAAHRIFDLDDLKELRGFSDDWVVSTWLKGSRGIARKEGDKVSVQYADGSYCSLTAEGKKGLREAHDDDFVMDVIVGKNKRITVIDLLEHDGKHLYDEPLKDRLTKLRSGFESTDDVHMPAPFNTRRTDDEGLSAAVSSLADEENDGFLLRDAISTYMKGEPRHPKWVLLRKQKEIDVIILDRRGRGPYTYRLGVGPINPEKGQSLGNRAMQRGDKWFMDVGTLTREEKAFNEGDYIQVNVSSVSHKERNGEDVYDIQPRNIIGETSTEATDSVDTLSLLVKSYAPLLWPHDVVVNNSDVQVLLHGVKDTVIYKMSKWDDGWVLHQPMSLLGDLSNSDYSIHLSESLRPFWEPIVGMTLKGLIKVDYNPRDTRDKTRDEKDEEEHSHESGFKLPKPKRLDDDQILKPEMTKMIVEALTLIDGVIAKEKATWTGARGMGIGLGTPDSAPRGPTEITQDVNTLDYDMRQRDDEKTEKPRKKPAKMSGEPHPMTASLTTDEGEKAKIRVTAEEAALEMEPENPLE
tara:strand:- start:31002 stop:36584 length:5583 start_codon:yes stop_codon:yes gene_type:complete